MRPIIHRLIALLTLVVFLLVQKPLPSQAAGMQARPATWTHCTVHLKLDFSGVSRYDCHTYRMPREHRTPLRHVTRQHFLSPHVVDLVKWPVFYTPPPPVPTLMGFEPSVRRWSSIIDGASRFYGVPARFIAAVMTVETHGNPAAVSSAGAIGLMQLLPGTAEYLGVNPWDPTQNVYGGTHYLAENGAATLDRGRLFYAAECYNGGPGNPGAGYGYALSVMNRY